MRKYQLILLAVFFGLLIVTLSGCAAGPNALVGINNEAGNVANIWFGLWHGFISPITLIISLFNREISIYEVHNTGFGYNAGYLLGLAIWPIGLSGK